MQIRQRTFENYPVARHPIDSIWIIEHMRIDLLGRAVVMANGHAVEKPLHWIILHGRPFHDKNTTNHKSWLIIVYITYARCISVNHTVIVGI